MRVPAGIARPRIGPGPAFVVVGASRLAGLVALIVFESEIPVIAAEAVDRGFDRAVAGFDHAGAPHTRDAAIVLDAGGHSAFEPADRAGTDIGRIIETPRPAALVTFADQRAIGGIARGDRRTQIVAAGTVEIGLRQTLARSNDGRQKGERHHTRPEQAAYPHMILLSTARCPASRHLNAINLYGG